MKSGAAKISVIMPVFNREHLVRPALESVLAQSYKPCQIIVVDDGSTDGTAAILGDFSPEVTVLRQSNQGPYPARNLALKHASGDYLAFIDSDDLWTPRKLEKQVSILDQHPQVGLVFSNGELLYARPATSAQPNAFFEIHLPARGSVFSALVKTNFIPQSSVLVRRKCFDEAGPFFEIPLAADYHKWLQIALRYDFEYIDEMLIRYRVHPGNISRDRAKKYRALNAVYAHLLASTADESARRILNRRILQSEYELALVERNLRRTINGLMDRDRGVHGFDRVRCLAEVTWRKSRSFPGLKSLLR